MKVTLNIVAAVLIAAGLVVAVASLLTPGQVILGIDFKLAATLVVGGLILQALANALSLLERMSSDLRQLRKAGSEEPPWLRQVTSQSAAAMAAFGATPVVAAAERDDRSANVAEDPFGLPPTMAADDEWPPEVEDHWPEPVEPEAAKAEAAAPLLAAETAQSDPWLERDFEPEPRSLQDLEPAGGTPREDSDLALEPEAPDVSIDDTAEIPAEPEPTVAQAEEAGAAPIGPEPTAAEPHVPIAPEPAAREPEEAEPDAQIVAEPVEDAPDLHAAFASKLKPSEDRTGGREDVASEPEMPPPSPDETAEEHPALYVVEERMFRGKQSRVLSDGTIEAETAEGWMRFEDFDHLEEYLDAMADLGR